MIDWIGSQAKSFASLDMELKVAQWKWYLSEFLCDQDVIAKGSVQSPYLHYSPLT